MKRFLQIALLVATGLSLSACGNLKNSDLANNPTTSTTKKKSYQTTSTSKNGYNVLLKDGEYVTSPIEGTTENTSDNNVDGRALESGLIYPKILFQVVSMFSKKGKKFLLQMRLIG